MDWDPYEAPIESSPAPRAPCTAADLTRLLLALALVLVLLELGLLMLSDNNLPGEGAIWLSWIVFWRVIPVALIVTLVAAAISHVADKKVRYGNPFRTLRPLRYGLRTLMIVLMLGPPAIASVWLWPGMVLLVMMMIVMVFCVLVACDCKPRL